MNNVFRDRLASAEGLDLLRSFVVQNGDVQFTSIVLLVAGCVIGVVGSGLAVSRFLDV
jgi:hypothetical protein